MKKIFIHGWGFSKGIWKDYSYIDRAMFLDLPSHGDDKRVVSKLEQFADEVASMVDQPAVVVGWSLGATVSLLASLKNQNIRKLVLIGFSPKFSDSFLGSDPKMVKAFMYSLSKDFQKTVKTFRYTAICAQSEDPIPQQDGATCILKDFVNLDITALLEKVRAKTFLVHGIHDKIVNPEAAIYSHQKIKDSEVILLDSHHGPFLEWDMFEVIDD